MRIQSSRRIQYVMGGGHTIDLLPGVPIDVAESVGRRIRDKLADSIQILEHDHDAPVIDPNFLEPPIKPGWIIGFFEDRKFRGGPQGGDIGLIERVVFDEEHNHQWCFYTIGDYQIWGTQVYAVWPIDRDGTLAQCYYTKQHGLDGRGYKYPDMVYRLAQAGARVDARMTFFSNLADQQVVISEAEDGSRPTFRNLTPEQQKMMDASSLSPEEFHALSAGDWSAEIRDRFWTKPKPIPAAVAPHSGSSAGRQQRIVIDLQEVSKEIRAWVCGSLAVHKSVPSPGYSITHVPSGRKVLSRIESKNDAVVALQRLLPLTDWTAVTIAVADLKRIKSVLATIPQGRNAKSRDLSP